MEWITTSTILTDLRDFRNRDAWDRLARRFRAPIVGFGAEMGLGRPDAEDAAQETLLAFAEAFRAGKYDKSRGRLNQWLFGIAYRQILNLRRNLARPEVQVDSPPDETSFFSKLPDEAEASRTWDTHWKRAVLEQCLSRVRHEVEPRTYRAFEMVTLEQQTTAETAEALGLTRNAVFIAKHRVATRIRGLRDEFENTGA